SHSAHRRIVVARSDLLRLSSRYDKTRRYHNGSLDCFDTSRMPLNQGNTPSVSDTTFATRSSGCTRPVTSSITGRSSTRKTFRMLPFQPTFVGAKYAGRYL